jgi:NhaA family Na+:H+ antiporter
MKVERIDRFLKPVHGFMHGETTAGIILMISALTAIVWSNSPWSESYFHLWEHELGISIGSYSIEKSLHHWINDGLMALFFFVVGLELKREIIAGELSDIRKAILPLSAAVGGMLFPALIFLLFNRQGMESSGWGIPMATDIAFALGILSLLGKRVPLSVKVFLVALAIADDLGAVLVIAFFYTSEISIVNLSIGILFLGILITGNYLGIRSSLFYGLIGIAGVWLAFLMSGVHATIAGVLTAAAIPARTRIDEAGFVKRLDELTQEFHVIPPNDVTLLEPEQYNVVEKIGRLAKAANTPLQDLEHQLHPWVAFLIMPLFAFSNAGIQLSTEVLGTTFFEGVSMGVLTGLVVGKFLGVLFVSWIIVRLKIASLPEGWRWGHLCGIALLSGIGFTMSLFVSSLAYTDVSFIIEAKVGIFVASIISGVSGYLVIRRMTIPGPSAHESSQSLS